MEDCLKSLLRLANYAYAYAQSYHNPHADTLDTLHTATNECYTHYALVNHFCSDRMAGGGRWPVNRQVLSHATFASLPLATIASGTCTLFSLLSKTMRSYFSAVDAAASLLGNLLTDVNEAPSAMRQKRISACR